MIKDYLHKTLKMPPHKSAKKVVEKFLQLTSEAAMRRKDENASSYVTPKFPHYCNEAGGMIPNLA